MINLHNGTNRGDNGSDNPPENALGFNPSPDWQSPFSSAMDEGSLLLFEKIILLFPKPPGWKELNSPVTDTKLLLLSPEGNASLVIGAGDVPKGSRLSTALANIAASPIHALVQNGVEIPIVISIPTISSIEGVDASHMLNFPAIAPGRLVGSKEEKVAFFKHTTVLGIRDKWISYETSSWGGGCNPAVESEFMGKLHLGLQIKKSE